MNKLYYLSPLLLQTAIWPLTRPILRFFCHLQIVGTENLLALKPGIIFASNHTGELDPILVPASLPFLSSLMPMFYTSREKEFYKYSSWRQAFYGGLFFKIWGSHRLHSGKHNYAASLQDHIKILQHRKSLLIFPEGRRTQDGQLQEGHGGVVFLSHTLNLPIVPVHISGHFKITFSDFIFRRRTIRIAFGKPIYAKDILSDPNNVVLTTGGRNDYKTAAQNIMKKIAELSGS